MSCVRSVFSVLVLVRALRLYAMVVDHSCPNVRSSAKSDRILKENTNIIVRR